MMVNITVASRLRSRIPGDATARLRRQLRRAGQRLGLGGDTATICVRLVDDAEMAQLHQAHMGIGGPTDVMSFPATPSPADDDGEQTFEELGDIVIDWDAVLRQAPRRTSRDAIDEMVGLAIHGLVHLLGHDHGKRHEARVMTRLEERAYRAARLPHFSRPYDPRR